MQEIAVQGVPAATLWRLRMAYLILQSATAVVVAFKERTECIPSSIANVTTSQFLSVVEAQTAALPHWLDLYIAGLNAQDAYDRLFKEVETAASKEIAMAATRTHSIQPPPSQPLQNTRHELFAKRIADGHSATAAYAYAYAKEQRTNACAVRGMHLVRNVNVRKRAMEIEAENALRTLPTFDLALRGFERRTLRAIEEASLQNVFHAADRFAKFVAKMNKAIEPEPGYLRTYVRGARN